MRGKREKLSPLEERLRELEREQRQLQSAARTLSNALRNPAKLGDALKRTVHSERPKPPPVRRDPVVPPPPPAGNEAPDELFSWERKDGGPSGNTLFPSAAPSVRAPVQGDQRFANYFMAGGLMGPRPLRQEKSVQRNKAIFMIVVVLVVAFLVYMFITR